MRLSRWVLMLLVLLIAAACTSAGNALPSLVSPREAQTRLESQENVILLDVRTPQEWATDGHAPQAVLIPLDELQARAAAELDESATILVICRSGNRSRPAADLLRQMGFSRVAEVEGGMRNWAAQGLEVVYD